VSVRFGKEIQEMLRRGDRELMEPTHLAREGSRLKPSTSSRGIQQVRFGFAVSWCYFGYFASGMLGSSRCKQMSPTPSGVCAFDNTTTPIRALGSKPMNEL
jgi:hypothetical protein